MRDALRARGVDVLDKERIWRASDGRVGLLTSHLQDAEIAALVALREQERGATSAARCVYAVTWSERQRAQMVRVRNERDMTAIRFRSSLRPRWCCAGKCLSRFARARDNSRHRDRAD